MSTQVILSIRGCQRYIGQEPDVIELVTDGVLRQTEQGWELRYLESHLTGLEGVETAFLVEPGKITLTRTGRLNSQMIFQEGKSHDSLYQMEFGALMITVCANRISWNIDANGGTVDLVYSIEIEQSTAGSIEYHLEIKSKK